MVVMRHRGTAEVLSARAHHRPPGRRTGAASGERQTDTARACALGAQSPGFLFGRSSRVSPVRRKLYPPCTVELCERSLGFPPALLCCFAVLFAIERSHGAVTTHSKPARSRHCEYSHWRRSWTDAVEQGA
jgi:hypothetical protein